MVGGRVAVAEADPGFTARKARAQNRSASSAKVAGRKRDELLEKFQIHYHPGASSSNEDDELDDELEEDEQEAGRED